jgi:acetyltransferase EpsM
MAEPLILIGSGEHARVVVEAIHLARRERLVGYVDSDPSPVLAEQGITYLGTDETLADYPGAIAVLGVGAIGASMHRRAIVARLAPVVAGWATVVHPHATIASDASIGAGTVVLAGAIVEPGSVIGHHCIVNTGAVVCHDVRVRDHAVVSPGAIVGGGVDLGPGCFIGMGAVIRDHCSVGSEAVVAMGAVIVSDVAEGSTVAGVPGRPVTR